MPDVHEVVRRICMHLPEVEEKVSHGMPEYRVAGKAFAQFCLNHHGDMRVGLILNSDRATQHMLVESAPRVFYVPAYSGPKGWFGIELASGVRMERVAELVRDAYVRVAPGSLAAGAEPLARVPKPDTLDIRKLDPFFKPANQALLKKLAKICNALPEVSEGKSFGSPVFKAGKKTFCEFNVSRDGVPAAYFRVGPDRQASLVLDQRFTIPPYTGHNGWIRLRLDTRFDEQEVAALALESYRHYALKRMLKALDGE